MSVYGREGSLCLLNHCSSLVMHALLATGNMCWLQNTHTCCQHMLYIKTTFSSQDVDWWCIENIVWVIHTPPSLHAIVLIALRLDVWCVLTALRLDVWCILTALRFDCIAIRCLVRFNCIAIRRLVRLDFTFTVFKELSLWTIVDTRDPHSFHLGIHMQIELSNLSFYCTRNTVLHTHTSDTEKR